MKVIHHLFTVKCHNLSFLLVIATYSMNGFSPRSSSFHTGETCRADTITTCGIASQHVIYLLHRCFPRRASAAANRAPPRAVRPMASSTWLGSSEPDVHAEPDEAQMPLHVEQQQQALALDALEAEVHVAGQARASLSPLSAQCGMLAKPCDQPVAQRGDLRCVLVQMVARILAAPPPCRRCRRTFSVPARLPRSCAPPSMMLVEDDARAGHTARPRPWARGTCDADMESISMCIRADIDSDMALPPAPRRCGTGRPARMAELRRSPRWAGWCRFRCWQT